MLDSRQPCRAPTSGPDLGAQLAPTLQPAPTLRINPIPEVGAGVFGEGVGGGQTSLLEISVLDSRFFTIGIKKTARPIGGPKHATL